MKSIPASEFLDRYVSAYGESWENTFALMTDKKPCAQHMAELIDDLEEYGQETPVYVDRSGMVSEGHAVALGLFILGKDVTYVNGNSPDHSDEQIWVVEFEVSGEEPQEEWFNHLIDYLSFRVEDDWVYPLEASMTDNEITVAMYCPSGEYTADRLAPIITERLESKLGLVVSGFYVTAEHGVDGEPT